MILEDGLEKPQTVSAFPTKRFFVGMFTRDIELQDAVLDLLDNCVDGIQRTLEHNGKAVSTETGALSESTEIIREYEGFWASIKFDENYFRISDNCGGIPLDSEAFRLGNPILEKDTGRATIGYYGIGMKRAIFKMGRSCTVTTKHGKDAYRVIITPDWLTNDELWDLPIEVLNPDDIEVEGTVIEITDLYEPIRNKFALRKTEAFRQEFERTVATHYSYIMHKGLAVYINEARIEPQFVHFQFATPGAGENGDTRRIAPFVYEGIYDDVNVFLIVGYYRDLPTEEEIEADLSGMNLTERAGWTIICNDRVVVYNNKDKLTGWGETSVPKYHTQFISIAGIVRFYATDVSKLPLTTTKRGIDAGTDVYLTVKNIMREGLKIFTRHTNKWKSMTPEREAMIKGTLAVEPFNVSQYIPEDAWTSVDQEVVGRKYVPKLPEPTSDDPKKSIKFSRPISEIKTVAEYLFGTTDVPNSEVGETCFQNTLDKTRS